MINGHQFQRMVPAAIFLIATAISGFTLGGENGEKQLRFADNRHCVFADRDATFPINYKTGGTSRQPRQVNGYLRVNRRIVARGKADLKPGQKNNATADLQMSIPSVKAGVVMSAQLEVIVAGAGSDSKNRADCRRDLYLFHPEPFSPRQQWLKERNIRLFDPDGKTAERFRNAKIPHEVIHNKSRIDGVSNGILFIGAGISLGNQRGLLENAQTAAESGAHVMLLGVKEGQANIPGITGARPVQPERIVFRGDDVVKSFNKKFDVLAYSTDAERRSKDLTIKAESGNIVGSFSRERSENVKRWSWLSAKYESGGHFVINSLPLVEKWETSPVPRYFLLEILKKWEETGKD